MFLFEVINKGYLQRHQALRFVYDRSGIERVLDVIINSCRRPLPDFRQLLLKHLGSRVRRPVLRLRFYIYGLFRGLIGIVETQAKTARDKTADDPHVPASLFLLWLWLRHGSDHFTCPFWSGLCAFS